jgi:hypothetical protein
MNENPFLPPDAYSPREVLQRLRSESARVCGPIDKRIIAMGIEYDALTDEYNNLMENIPSGFFARLSFNGKIRNLGKRMNLNRDMLAILYRKRIANT